MNPNPFKIEKGSSDKGGLFGKYRHSWVEDSFDIERESANNNLAISHTKNYLGSSIGQKNIIKFLLIIIGGILILYGKTFYLQAIKGSQYSDLAEGNRIRLVPVPAARGIFLDRFNRELVRNTPSFSLSTIPQDIPSKPEERQPILDKIAQISGVTTTAVDDLLKKYGSYSYESITLKDNIDYQTALQMYVENSDLPGVRIESGSKRLYQTYNTATSSPVFITSLSPLLGYLGKLNLEEFQKLHDDGYLASDQIGKTGLEKYYEKDLRGIYGRKKIEVNASGKEQNVLALDPPAPGNNLILSIDLDAQQTLEKLVKDAADHLNKRRIAAIAMNPQNGDILAMVSWPTFDNNDFSGGIDTATYKKYLDDKDRPLFNRVISGGYPPGSTFKLIMVAAALQEKIATINTAINSVGGIDVGGIMFKDWKIGGHGVTNVIKALAWSINSYFYYIGGGYKNFEGLGLDRIVKYMKAFGLGSTTGIDLPAENDGFLPSREWKMKQKNEPWYTGDTYNISIGQGDTLVTPLQVALWTAAIANGGDIVTPHLVNKIVDSQTKKVTEINYPKKNNKLVSAENINIVRSGLRECVLTGSCQLLKKLPFTSAGKTGTAQWSRTKATHAWFTAFAPYQNPQIEITVLIEEGGEGGIVSIPIAEQFLAWWGQKYYKP